MVNVKTIQQNRRKSAITDCIMVEENCSRGVRSMYRKKNSMKMEMKMNMETENECQCLAIDSGMGREEGGHPG